MAKKSYNPTCLVTTLNSRHHDMTVKSANQLLHFVGKPTATSVYERVHARCTETSTALISDFILVLSVIIKRMCVIVSEYHMLDWHSCQICYTLEIKLLLLLL